MSDTALVVRDVAYRYLGSTSEGPLTGVSFEVKRGETFAIAGLSGCGKSTLARIVAGLLRPSSGSLELPLAQRRGSIQMVFQEPGASLNPRLRIRATLAEPMRIQLRRRPGPSEIAVLLERVGLAPGLANCYPHELSGGQKQRVAIARAIASQPNLIVCDEPTSALDPTTQAQVINLLATLQRESGMACLLFSHDLAVISQMADRIGILFDGKICESGDARLILTTPRHSHTIALCREARSVLPDS